MKTVRWVLGALVAVVVGVPLALFLFWWFVAAPMMQASLEAGVGGPRPRAG